VLANVLAALQAAGSGLEHIAQVRVYVTDIGDWPRFNEIYAEWIGPVHRPARAVVPVPHLHHGFKIEVEAVGVVSTENSGTRP
jgi:2-iminobutanoate/2-iminopropanoate deaminase